MTDSTLQVNVTGRDTLSPVMAQLESKLIRFVGAVSSAVAAVKVAAFPLAAAANFEREMANVKKTTEFTTAGIRELGDELKQLSLRVNVSVLDLAKIAAAAGQQGLGSLGPKGVAKFTDSVARMASVLDITADQAANDVGKIMNVFHLGIDQIENVVSGFNQSSNNSTASGEQLLNVVRRIGDAAGTINLQESIGLSATGIDFGMSPEVVGTSYGKVFADMRAKAEEFAAVMQMTTKQWIGVIDEEGGIAAYKQYLAKIRKMDSESQAKTISELNGRGRIFSLVNKNVQDASDGILNKNLADAKAGFVSGTSAIKEQRTVLETLVAQYEILKNSVFSLGTEAGDQMLAPLTAYVAQLSAALQAPAVKSFARATGAAILDLMNLVASLTKYIGGLNVNWENLINVAKVFVAVKVGEMMLGLTARATGLSTAYARLAAASTAAGGAQMGMLAALRLAFAGQETAFGKAQAAFATHLAARRAATAAEATHARAIMATTAAENAMRAAAGRELPLNRVANTAAGAATAGAAATAAARANAAAATAALTNTLNTKVAASTIKHQQTIAAIESSFAGRRGVADLANKQALIDAETRHFARQTAGYNSYYSRRILAAEANGLRLIAVAEVEQARLNAVYARAEAARLSAAGQTAAASAALARADAATRAAAAGLISATTAANAARVGFFNLGLTIAGVGSVIKTALSFFLRAFLVLTILYMVLDSFGLLKGLPAFFQKITDALGMTSEAARKATQTSKDLADQMAKETAKVKELTDEYTKLKDSRTGGLDPTQITGIKSALKDGAPDARQKAVSLLGRSLRGADADVMDKDDAINTVKYDAQRSAENLAKYKVALDAAKKLKKDHDAFVAKGGYIHRDVIKKDNDTIAQLQATYDAALKTSQSYAGIQKAGLTAALNQSKENKEQLREVVNGLFTPESAQLFQNYIVKISEADTAIDRLTTKRAEAQKELDKIPKTPEGAAQRNAAQATIDEYQRQINEARSAVGLLREAFKEARKVIMDGGSLKEAVLRSVGALDAFANAEAQVVATFAAALRESQGKGEKLDGSLAPAVTPTTTRGNERSPEETSQAKAESEARRAAKARVDIAKAQTAAVLALTRERNDQLATVEQAGYDKGLISIASYYSERERIQLKNNTDEQAALKDDVRTVSNEKATRKKEGAEPSELLKFDADIIRLNGQIAVLQEKRKGITGDTARDVAEATDALATKINATNLELADALGVTDIDTFFNQNLTAYNERYKEFYDRLLTEGGEGGKKLVEQLQSVGNVESVGKAMDKVGERTEKAYAQLDRYTARLSNLRTTGKITTAQFEAESARARAALAVMVQRDITAQEQALAALTTAADRATDAYKNLKTVLDENKLKLETLQSVANQVATNINTSIASGIASAFTTIMSGPQDIELNAAQQKIMEDNDAAVERLRDNIAFLERARSGVLQGYEGQNAGLDAQLSKSRQEMQRLQEETAAINEQATESILDSILRAAGELGTTVATSIRDAITQDLAESATEQLKGLVKSIGGGEDGIGGFFASMLGGEKPDGSKAKPFFIKDADTEGEAISDMVEDPVGTIIDTFKEKAGSAFNFLSDGLNSLLGGFGDSFSDVLSGLLKSLGGSGGIGQAAGSFFASLFHSGGVVGSTYSPRFTSPAMFQHAMKYHSGGIAGLQPNEVPAILMRGEEVLTQSDPRHRDNASGSGGTSVQVHVNVESGQKSTVGDSAGAKEFGKRIAEVVQREIMVQKRPGGMLA